MKVKIILITLIVSIIACKKESKKIDLKQDTIFEKIDITVGKHCFESVIINEIIKGKDTIVEKDFLNVNLEIEGGKVTGNYSFKPNNKTINIGTFEGIIKDNIITSIYTHVQKDISLKEEIIFNIQQNKIALLGGEKELKNGISYFKDKSKGIYMIKIPRVLCNDTSLDLSSE